MRNDNSTNIGDFIWNQRHPAQDFEFWKQQLTQISDYFLSSQYIHLTKPPPYQQPQTFLTSVVNLPWKTISILFLTCTWKWLSVYLWGMKTHTAPFVMHLCTIFLFMSWTDGSIHIFLPEQKLRSRLLSLQLAPFLSSKFSRYWTYFSIAFQFYLLRQKM